MSDSTDRAAGAPATEGLERELRADYLREDERWSAANQARDALIIFLVGVVVFAWMFIVFLVEPGIR